MHETWLWEDHGETAASADALRLKLRGSLVFGMSSRDVKFVNDLKIGKGALLALIYTLKLSAHKPTGSYNSDVTALIPIPDRQLDAPHDAESRCTRDHMQAISVQLRLCVRATPLPLINARTVTVISKRHCPATLSGEIIQNQRVDDAHSIRQRLLHSQVL
jgi:hypothetical protein